MKGKLIVIEGTDCSGKETQTKMLTKRLEKQVFILKRQFESERTARNRTTSSSTSSQSF
jgi:thymidylate kinase